MDSKFEKWNELPPDLRSECVQWMDYETKRRLRATSHSDKLLIEYSDPTNMRSWVPNCILVTSNSPPRMVRESLQKAQKTEQVVEKPKENGILKYEKFPTNWIDLPMEMRLECIKRMELMCRARLRATSHTEKLLVESAPKYHFNEELGVLFGDPTSAKNWFSEIRVDPLLMISTIVRLSSSSFPFEEFHYDELVLDCEDDEEKALLFLWKSCEKVKTLHLVNFTKDEKKVMTAPFVKCPVVYNANTLYIYFAQEAAYFTYLVKKWIEKDAELETQLWARRIQEPNGISLIAKDLADRIVYKRPREIRIRTDNSAKHILIRHIPGKFYPHFVRILVISADLKESEYELGNKLLTDFNYKFLFCEFRYDESKWAYD